MRVANTEGNAVLMGEAGIRSEAVRAVVIEFHYICCAFVTIRYERNKPKKFLENRSSTL
jgi:hypothetical protein